MGKEHELDCLECYARDLTISELQQRIKMLEDILDRVFKAWDTGELQCDVMNGYWWSAVEDAEKALAGGDK